jgi:hypothetical protein
LTAIALADGCTKFTVSCGAMLKLVQLNESFGLRCVIVVRAPDWTMLPLPAVTCPPEGPPACANDASSRPPGSRGCVSRSRSIDTCGSSKHGGSLSETLPGCVPYPAMNTVGALALHRCREFVTFPVVMPDLRVPSQANAKHTCLATALPRQELPVSGNAGIARLFGLTQGLPDDCQ